MNKHLIVVGACLVAVLWAAAPAFAGGDMLSGLPASVQVDVDPGTLVSAPVAVDAPVCIAAACDDGGGQAASDASSPAAVAAPVSANAPVCVAASCHRSSTASSSAGSAPAVVSAPVAANAPVCVLSSCHETRRSTGSPPASPIERSSSTAGTASPAAAPQSTLPTPSSAPAARAHTSPKARPSHAATPAPGRAGVQGLAKTSERGGTTPERGVLAETVAERGALPFTGLRLPSIVAAAAVLCLAGTSLRRSRLPV